METRGDQAKHETPLERGGTQRLLLGMAILAAIGIWISTVGLATPAFTPRSSDAPLLRLDLNAAGTRELSLLPAIGPALAKRIVENRSRLGPFVSVEDLGRVHGIGEKSIAGLRNFVFVDSR